MIWKGSSDPFTKPVKTSSITGPLDSTATFISIESKKSADFFSNVMTCDHSNVTFAEINPMKHNRVGVRYKRPTHMNFRTRCEHGKFRIARSLLGISGKI